MNLQSIFKGSLFVFAFSIVSAFLGYLIRIIMAWTMTTAEIGLFFAIFSVLSIMFFIKDCGLGSALAKFIPSYKIKYMFNEIKTMMFIFIAFQTTIGSLLIILLWIFSGFLANNYFHNPSAVWIIKAMSFYLILGISFKFFKKAFQGFQSLFWFSILDVIKNIVVIICLLLISGINGAVVGYLLSGLIIWLLFIPLYQKFNFFKYSITNVKPIAKEMFLFGMPMILSVVGAELISYSNTLIMTGLRSLSEVGIYSVVISISWLLLLIGECVNAVIYPMISKHWAMNDYESVKNFYRVVFICFPLLIPLGLIAWFGCPLILKLFFTNEYLAGTLTLQILCIGMIFYSINNINLCGLSAIGKPKTNALVYITTAIVNTALGFVLIYYYGMVGGALSLLFSFLFAMIFSSILIKRNILNAQNNSENTVGIQ